MGRPRPFHLLQVPTISRKPRGRGTLVKLPIDATDHSQGGGGQRMKRQRKQGGRISQ